MSGASDELLPVRLGRVDGQTPIGAEISNRRRFAMSTAIMAVDTAATGPSGHPCRFHPAARGRF